MREGRMKRGMETSAHGTCVTCTTRMGTLGASAAMGAPDRKSDGRDVGSVVGWPVGFVGAAVGSREG